MSKLNFIKITFLSILSLSIPLSLSAKVGVNGSSQGQGSTKTGQTVADPGVAAEAMNPNTITSENNADPVSVKKGGGHIAGPLSNVFSDEAGVNSSDELSSANLSKIGEILNLLNTGKDGIALSPNSSAFIKVTRDAPFYTELVTALSNFVDIQDGPESISQDSIKHILGTLRSILQGENDSEKIAALSGLNTVLKLLDDPGDLAKYITSVMNNKALDAGVKASLQTLLKSQEYINATPVEKKYAVLSWALQNDPQFAAIHGDALAVCACAGGCAVGV